MKFISNRARHANDIARVNADMAIDQGFEYKDSISAYAQNVRDTLDEKGLSQFQRAALAVYYTRIAELLNSAPTPAPSPEVQGADSPARPLSTAGGTTFDDAQSRNIRAIIAKAESDGLTIDDGNVVDLIADNVTTYTTLVEIRLALVAAGLAERFPRATRNVR